MPGGFQPETFWPVTVDSRTTPFIEAPLTWLKPPPT